MKEIYLRTGKEKDGVKKRERHTFPEMKDLNAAVAALEAKISALEAKIGSCCGNTDPCTGKTVETELAYIKAQKLTPEQVAERYYKTTNTKNCFSTTELYQAAGGTEKRITELNMAIYIVNSL